MNETPADGQVSLYILRHQSNNRTLPSKWIQDKELLLEKKKKIIVLEKTVNLYMNSRFMFAFYSTSIQPQMIIISIKYKDSEAAESANIEGQLIYEKKDSKASNTVIWVTVTVVFLALMIMSLMIVIFYNKRKKSVVEKDENNAIKETYMNGTVQNCGRNSLRR